MLLVLKLDFNVSCLRFNVEIFEFGLICGLASFFPLFSPSTPAVCHLMSRGFVDCI